MIPQVPIIFMSFVRRCLDAFSFDEKNAFKVTIIQGINNGSRLIGPKYILPIMINPITRGKAAITEGTFAIFSLRTDAVKAIARNHKIDRRLQYKIGGMNLSKTAATQTPQAST